MNSRELECYRMAGVCGNCEHHTILMPNDEKFIKFYEKARIVTPAEMASRRLIGCSLDIVDHVTSEFATCNKHKMQMCCGG